MDMLEIIGEVIGLGCLGFLLFYEGIVPRSPNAFFRKVMEDYRKVESGELSYIAYKEDLRNECQHRMRLESIQTVRFKEVLLGMLNYDDFIRTAFSDPCITVEELREKWKMYDPLTPTKSQRVPVIFLHGEGKDIMDWMVGNGYCQSSCLGWIYKGENSSYLMVLFADAIGKELGFGRARWREFVPIWGDRNYSDLFERARNCGNKFILRERVRALFPDYNIP